MTLAIEEWRPVVGFEGLYEVSDHGRVRSVRRGQVRIRKPTCRGVDGYMQLCLHRHGSVTTRSVHILVLEAFVGPRPEGTECCHGDGDRANNYLGNLRWDTHSANVRDSIRHGTHRYESLIAGGGRGGPGKRTHCPLGHELVRPNLRANMLAAGRRGCLACHRARSAVRYAATCGRSVDLQARADSYFEQIMSHP